MAKRGERQYEDERKKNRRDINSNKSGGSMKMDVYLRNFDENKVDSEVSSQNIDSQLFDIE